MTEAAATVFPGALHGSINALPTWREYDLEPRWYEGLSRCSLHLGTDAVVARDALLAKVFQLKNTPDPAPDQLNAIVRAAHHYSATRSRLPAPALTSVQSLAAALGPRSPRPARSSSAAPDGQGQQFLVRPGPAPTPREPLSSAPSSS